MDDALAARALGFDTAFGVLLVLLLLSFAWEKSRAHIDPRAHPTVV